MIGRLAIHSHKQRIKAVFERSDGLSEELLADHAKYLCILVSGFIEKSLSEIVLEHARRHSTLSIQRFVEIKTSRFTNAKPKKIIELLGSFDSDWQRMIEAILVDQNRAAFESVINLRNQIAHGALVGITFVQIKEYFKTIVAVIDEIQQICIPDN